MKDWEDLKTFIGNADLHYRGIDRIPEAGMPVGNGRMGSLIWFQGEEMHMQWNRSDVFANDSTTQSFREECSDYNAGTGIIDLNLGTGADCIFDENLQQHLSVYDGYYRMEAEQVFMEVFLDMDRDICYLHLQDHREIPQKVRLSLRTLRGGCLYVTGSLDQPHPSMYQTREKKSFRTYVQTGKHLATSILEQEKSVLRLRQFFEEKQFVCQSVLEIRSFGRQGYTFLRNQNEAVLEWPAGGEDIWISIETAAAFQKEELAVTGDVPMQAAEFEHRRQVSEEWWHAFWNRVPRMQLHSADHSADMVGMYHIWFYYLMACTSRGEYMPRFGGLLFYSGGDFRYWGAQFWWHNQACYYSPLVQEGCFELADAFYKHISHGFGQYEKAARQQWGTEGIFIPETCWFSGPCDIPDDLIQEFQELFTLQKPWEERSQAYREFAANRNLYESRWNGELSYNRQNSGYGPYGYVSHIFSSTAKIALQFWRRYRQTKDKKWLEQKAYPVIRGAAQMYCHLPFLQKKEDGWYHLCHVNNHENIWDGTDTVSELSGVHGILPVAVAAAQELGIDEQLQQEWMQMNKKIVPIRTNKDPGALIPCQDGEKEKWCCGTEPARMVRKDYYHNMDPVNIYELVTLETPEGHLRELADNTYEQVLKEHGFGTEDAHISELEPFIISISRMGDKKAMKYYLPMLLQGQDHRDSRDSVFWNVLDNRMTLREGVQALSAERIGQISEAVALSLCSCVSAEPGKKPVLHLFPSYPDEWDASFFLPAANGYWVNAEKRNGQICRIELSGDSTETLEVCNPWGTEKICIDYGDGKEYTKQSHFVIHGNCSVYLALES